MRFPRVVGLVFTGALLILGAAPSSASSGATITGAGWWVPLGVTVAPDGTAYIADMAGKGVSVVLAGGNEASRILKTDLFAAAVALSGDGTVFVEGTASGPTQQQLIGVIPSDAGAVTRTIPISRGDHLIAAAPDGTVYVPNHELGTVSVIPPGAAAVAREIPVPAGPREVAVGKDGTAYVTSQEAGTVSVIPSGAGAVSKTIQVGAAQGVTDNPHGIALGPDGSVYVANITGNAIAVIKPGGASVAYRVPVMDPKEVAVGADGTVYALATAQNLSMIRPGGTEVALSVAASARPGHLAAAPNGSVLVTNPEEHTVSVIGPELLRPVATTAAAAQSTAAQSPSGTPSQQAQATSDHSSAWGSVPVVLGSSVLVLAAAAVVIVAGRRRRQKATLDTPGWSLEQLEPERDVSRETAGGNGKRP